jgi:hypothetical protein
MDLTQRKLTKQEWEGIEVPVSPEEKTVLKMIREGFNDINIKHNKNQSLIKYAKLEDSDVMQAHIFNLYLKKRLEKIYKKSDLSLQKIKGNGKLAPKKRDLIRLENVEKTLEQNKDKLYEFTILDLIEKMLTNHNKGRDKWMLYYYTLFHLQFIQLRMNSILQKEVDILLESFSDDISHKLYFENVESVLEKNDVLLRYTDMELYEHQKRIFNAFQNPTPKLVLYVAPTGTGKTLTPIGLSEKYRVIFICAARHVGLALAKSAISAGRKIALAFNCGDAEDIRLHWAAAKEFTKNYRTGGIFRVDNSVGDNVEIMISDVQSYTIAMLYMTAFSKKENIITYWDEPTITMDYDTHPFHEIIQKNWRENVIPNIVLSSATLPREEEIRDVIGDYISRFQGQAMTILSADCNNSIPLISKEGSVTLPHHLPENADYQVMMNCIEHCKKSSSLIRYMDLREICRFIMFINEEDYIRHEHMHMQNYFESTEDITIKNIKMYYLKLFSEIEQHKWGEVFTHFQANRHIPYESNILITTKDAHTLTHGPSIYLANDIEKVARFYLQQTKIPNTVIDKINEHVRKNDKINAEIQKMEKTFEEAMAKEDEKEKKAGNDDRMPPEMKQLRRKIENLQQLIKSVSMPEMYVPNSREHLYKWANGKETEQSFTPEIADKYVIKLMQLNDVEPIWKILLLMGIGVFMHHESIGYVEIMKELAQEQKLLLILATDDYIYGTNYQFCHGYLGKDLVHLTQEKIIQALGRVGRNKQNKDYSMRMRDNSFISKIFTPLDVKQEAEMMNKLFSSQ